MNEIFVKLGIINDLSKMILNYLTMSHNNILASGGVFFVSDIIKYDYKMMPSLMLEADKFLWLEKCSKYKKSSNISWMLEKRIAFWEIDDAHEIIDICWGNLK
jgi:hypothetical protein